MQERSGEDPELKDYWNGIPNWATIKKGENKYWVKQIKFENKTLGIVIGKLSEKFVCNKISGQNKVKSFQNTFLLDGMPSTISGWTK